MSIPSDSSANRLRMLNRLSRLGVDRNAMLADIVAHTEKELLDYEVAPVASRVIANGVADRLADFWGGQFVGIPRDFAWKLAQKELELYDQFKGNNMEELIRASGMTDRGLRKLFARIRSKLSRQRAIDQKDMFERS